MRHLSIGAWLTAVWCALWADLSAANLLSGAAISAMLLALFPTPRDPRHGTLRPLAAVGYLGYFLGQLVVSNLQVVWQVLTPGRGERSAILAVPVVASCSPTVLSVLVNSIGLTPGTMVVDLTEEPRVIYVHVLQVDDVDRARAGLMRMQRLAVGAFGSAEAVAELDRLPETGGPRGGAR